MEEMTFLDSNPMFQKGGDAWKQAYNATAGPGTVDRLLDPSIAEWAQFSRENYFADKANAFNEYMWNKSNEYNSPVAQMKRLKEAGINPLLASAGIAGNGNATAQPMQGAQGQAGMNTNTFNPIEQLGNIMKTVLTAGQAGTEFGKLFGFGEENKATINQINQIANKAAQEADFTFWQKRQFRRTMRIMYDQAEKNLQQTEANIKVLKETYEKYQQEKFNTAADTNLKVAETGEKLQETKNLQYKNAEEAFKKIFRDLYGIQLNESDMSMLVQAVLGKNGDKIIDSIVDSFGRITMSIGKNIKEGIKNQFVGNETKTAKEISVEERAKDYNKWLKNFTATKKWIYEHNRGIRKYWEKRGGFDAYLKQMLSEYE